MSTTVSINDAKKRLTALARLVERGETAVVARNGKPILDLVPHRPRGGLHLAAIEAFRRARGIGEIFGAIAEDFDEPLPEEFLLQPLR